MHCLNVWMKNALFWMNEAGSICEKLILAPEKCSYFQRMYLGRLKNVPSAPRWGQSCSPCASVKFTILIYVCSITAEILYPSRFPEAEWTQVELMPRVFVSLDVIYAKFLRRIRSSSLVWRVGSKRYDVWNDRRAVFASFPVHATRRVSRFVRHHYGTYFL